VRARLFGMALALAPALLLAPAARAQNSGLGIGGQDSDKPITIESERGIEWQQNNHVYIARGHAKATRGQATVFGDTLYAYYRPVAKANSAGAANGNTAPRPASPAASSSPSPGTSPAAGGGKPGDPMSGSSTEIYRLEADGNVRIATETQTVYCDHAIYDVDQTLLVATGKHLKLETPRDTLTARDSLEWYDNRQLAVARGDAVAVQEGGKALRGDVLTADVTKAPDGSSHISRVDAQGNVLVSSQGQIGRGDSGVYNVDTGIATLAGHVTLTRGDNELRGQYGVVDLNNNVSRLLSAPPGTQVSEGPRPRVQGLLVPRPKPEAPGAKPGAAAAKPEGPASKPAGAAQ
jgi:lipopolysaccharide export system protein LptA